MKTGFLCFNKLNRLLFLLSCSVLPAVAVALPPTDAGKILVTNRTSGTLSVIDVATDMVVETVSLAVPGFRPPDPMYVSFIPKLKQVFVNDRTNDALTVLDAETFELLDSVPVGKGAFHMWADPNGKQLWAVNDIDKTMTVINPTTLDTLTTIPIPSDLAELGGKPHDVALDNTGKAAFVTILGTKDKKGYVLRYDTKTFKLTHRAEVGGDPHVGLAWKKAQMYVACQDDDQVYVLSTKDLRPVHEPISVPNTHGTGWSHKDATFFTTNITEKGVDGLFAINTLNHAVIGKANTGEGSEESLEDVPHNIAISGNDSKLYISHSGHDEGEFSGVVTVYDIRDPKEPTYLHTIHVGLNPFGIAYMGAKSR